MMIDTNVLVYAYDRVEPEKQRRVLAVLDELARSDEGVLSAQVVLETIWGVHEYKFSFWGARIWAAARLSQVTTVLSEDFSLGAVIEGVRFVDPFADDVRLQDWEMGV